MLGDAELVAFIPTVDSERSRAFYRDMVGLRLVESTPFADVFDAAGTVVRLTPVEALTPQPFTVIGWVVADIEAEVADLAGRGVAFRRFAGMDQDELGIWRSPGGARVAWFDDPDGNLCSLTQVGP